MTRRRYTMRILIAFILATAAAASAVSPTASAHCGVSAGPSEGIHTSAYSALPRTHVAGAPGPWLSSEMGDCDGGECSFNLGVCREGCNAEVLLLASCTAANACYLRAGWLWPRGLEGGFGARRELWVGADSGAACVDQACTNGDSVLAGQAGVQPASDCYARIAGLL